MNPVIQTDKLSKWYGNVLGLSDVSIKIETGITGLLGPNGAGKSTFMKLMTGQLKPSIGKVLIQGERARNNYTLFSRMGYCPEYDVFYDELTGWQFITGMLKLNHFSSPDVEKNARKAMEIVELMQDKDRVIRSYSRGMRQRLKFAQAIAHENNRFQSCSS
jgi:ABC-2 type transport system ATP-binding protein